MRENRPYGSEGGGTEFNRSFLPLSFAEILKLDSMSPVSNLRKSEAVAHDPCPAPLLFLWGTLSRKRFVELLDQMFVFGKHSLAVRVQ